jgi:hypothetical protein
MGDIQDQSSKSAVGRSPEHKKCNREVNNDPLEKLKMPKNRLGLPKSLILFVPHVSLLNLTAKLLKAHDVGTHQLQEHSVARLTARKTAYLGSKPKTLHDYNIIGTVHRHQVLIRNQKILQKEIDTTYQTVLTFFKESRRSLFNTCLHLQSRDQQCRLTANLKTGVAAYARVGTKMRRECPMSSPTYDIIYEGAARVQDLFLFL